MEERHIQDEDLEASIAKFDSAIEQGCAVEVIDPTWLRAALRELLTLRRKARNDASI
jgi:hypothetical protein